MSLLSPTPQIGSSDKAQSIFRAMETGHSCEALEGCETVCESSVTGYVEDHPSGKITGLDSAPVTGPQPPCITDRCRPHRKDRAWSWAWSLEQFFHRLKKRWSTELSSEAAATHSASGGELTMLKAITSKRGIQVARRIGPLRPFDGESIRRDAVDMGQS